MISDVGNSDKELVANENDTKCHLCDMSLELQKMQNYIGRHLLARRLKVQEDLKAIVCVINTKFCYCVI